MGSKKELIDKQARFWVLMAQGSTLIAACDAVGVNDEPAVTGGQATGGQVPRKKLKSSSGYPGLEEHLQIDDLHRAGRAGRASPSRSGAPRDGQS